MNEVISYKVVVEALNKLYYSWFLSFCVAKGTKMHVCANSYPAHIDAVLFHEYNMLKHARRKDETVSAATYSSSDSHRSDKATYQPCFS